MHLNFTGHTVFKLVLRAKTLCNITKKIISFLLPCSFSISVNTCLTFDDSTKIGSSISRQDTFSGRGSL